VEETDLLEIGLFRNFQTSLTLTLTVTLTLDQDGLSF